MQDRKIIRVFKGYITLEHPNITLKVTENEITSQKDDGTPLKSISITALYGIVQLQIKYACFVSKSQLVATINGKSIYQAQKFEFLPVAGKSSSQDIIYIQMMLSVLQSGFFYFSDDYDLTNSLQSQIHKNDKYQSAYFYNLPHLLSIFELGSLEWVTPFISGLVVQEEIMLQNKKCQFIIISRRDRNRSGYRYTSRGSDLVYLLIQDGNCSNFAQNELIFIIHDKQKQIDVSYLQTRGSMPFLWISPPTLKYAPTPEISKQFQASKQAARRHFDTQIKQLGPQVLVNLIDKKKNELKLGQNFEFVVNSLSNPQIKYVWFDFHKECAKMQYNNLSKLMDQIQSNVQDQKFFMAIFENENYTIESLQSGVVRTNCMDCLDRTNVVQSVIGRNILLKVLSSYNLAPKPDGSAFQVFPQDLETVFRNSWTKNADAMSIQYTGTPALKTDFTRQNIQKELEKEPNKVPQMTEQIQQKDIF